MADVQAIVELFLNVTQFYNLDLRYFGYYQIRCHIKFTKKHAIRVEISIPRSKAPHLFPANLVNGQAVGTTFEIFYKTEQIHLDDVIIFKIFQPICPYKLPKMVPIVMDLELWFIEKDELLKKQLDDVHSKFQCIAKRSVTVNLPIFRGLHYRRPILFDYFHLSALVLTVHASLVGLQIGGLPDGCGTPRESKSKLSSGQNTSQSVEEIFFRSCKSQDQRVQNSYEFHRNICWLLLTAYEALELKFVQLISCLPSHCQIRIQSVDCAKKLEILQQNLQRCIDEAEISQSILTTTKLLSSELALLWCQFLDLFKRQPPINKRLASEHHQLRVRRFAENFLCSENSTANLLSNNLGQNQKLHENLVDFLRKSAYCAKLPPLPVSCSELDGSPHLTPVIFEERFSPTCQTQKFNEIKNNANTEGFQLKIHSSSVDAAPSSKAQLPSATKTANTATFGDAPTSRKCLNLRLSGVCAPTVVESSSIHQTGVASLLCKSPLGPKSTALHSVNDVVLPMLTDADVLLPLERRRAESCGDWPVCVDEFLLAKVFRRAFSHSALQIIGNMPENKCSCIFTGPTDLQLNVDYSANFPSDLKCATNGVLEHCEIYTRDIAADLRTPSVARLTSGIDPEIFDALSRKEVWKMKMKTAGFDGHLASDFAAFPSKTPYFEEIWQSLYNAGAPLTDFNEFIGQLKAHSDFHLVVCVHGLEGTSADLKMVKTYLELAQPDESLRIRFLMSCRNQVSTFDDFEMMSTNLVDELLLSLSRCEKQPSRISFIGHSLGNIIIRSALCDPRLQPYLHNLHTFLSLNGPHCGLLYNNSSVVNMGLKVIQRLKKSVSLQQLTLRDNEDFRQCFVYKLSQKPCLQFFKHVLLVGSFDDNYVPIHSALIEYCKASYKDSTLLGSVYSEMVQNLIQPLVALGRTTVIRYSVHHSPQASSTASQWLGRAAHVAVLDSDLFIEKLITVSALKFFE